MTTSDPPAAAEIANAISEGMNLLFLFAAPLVLAAVRRSGFEAFDRASTTKALHRFLKNAGGIQARARTISGDVERLVSAAALVEEIAAALPATSFEDALPARIVEPARRALSILGFTEPAGGWDAFEGFSVGYSLPPQGR